MVLIDKIKNLNDFVKESNQSTEIYSNHKEITSSKGPYSHGLEEIYSIQTVDVQKIRKVTHHKQTQSLGIKTSDKEEIVDLELDLGSGFRNYVRNTYLDEPIEVLDLSSYTVNILLENNIPTLEDLKKAIESDLASLPGVGQGHIDEIQRNLNLYITGKLEKTKRVDLESLFRAITRLISRESSLVLIDRLEIKNCMPWLNKKQNSLKHYKKELRDNAIAKMYKELKNSAVVEFVKDFFQEIAHAFIIPWLNTRSGIASKEEVYEFLEQHLIEKECNSKLLYFFSNDILGQRFIFNHCLPKVSHEKIWCTTYDEVSLIERLKDLTLSYFYSGHLSYPVDLIARKLEVEFAKSWTECSYYKMLKYYKLSGLFRTQRKKDNKTYVLLSYV